MDWIAHRRTKVPPNRGSRMRLLLRGFFLEGGDMDVASDEVFYECHEQPSAPTKDGPERSVEHHARDLLSRKD